MKKGAPVKFGAKDVDRVLMVGERVLKHADGQKEISLDVIQGAAGIKFSPTSVRKAFKERCITEMYSWFVPCSSSEAHKCDLLVGGALQEEPVALLLHHPPGSWYYLRQEPACALNFGIES